MGKGRKEEGEGANMSSFRMLFYCVFPGVKDKLVFFRGGVGWVPRLARRLKCGADYFPPS